MILLERPSAVSLAQQSVTQVVVRLSTPGIKLYCLPISVDGALYVACGVESNAKAVCSPAITWLKRERRFISDDGGAEVAAGVESVTQPGLKFSVARVQLCRFAILGDAAVKIVPGGEGGS